eukprot:sb/3469966/
MFAAGVLQNRVLCSSQQAHQIHFVDKTAPLVVALPLWTYSNETHTLYDARQKVCSTRTSALIGHGCVSSYCISVFHYRSFTTRVKESQGGGAMTVGNFTKPEISESKSSITKKLSADTFFSPSARIGRDYNLGALRPLYSNERHPVGMRCNPLMRATRNEGIERKAAREKPRKTLKSGCLSLLTIRSFGARDGLGLTVRVWLGFGLRDRLGLSIL